MLPRRLLAAALVLLGFLAATAPPAAADRAPGEPVKLAVAHHRYHRATPVARGQHSQSGKASYYNATPGGCAHRTLPKGTRVTVHGPRGVTTCTVDDRGPFVAGRILDLSPAEFSAIAGGTSAGVVSVTITW